MRSRITNSNDAANSHNILENQITVNQEYSSLSLQQINQVHQQLVLHILVNINLSITSFILLLNCFLNINSIVLSLLCFTVQIPTFLYVFWKKKTLQPLIVMNAVSLGLWLFVCFVLFCKKLNLLYIPTTIYCFVCLAINILFVENKRIVMLILVVLGQITLIAFKLDGKIQSNWQTAILPLTIIQILLLLTCLFLAPYLVAVRICLKDQLPFLYQVKYCSIVVFSLFFQLAIPITLVYFQQITIYSIALVVALINHLVSALYLQYSEKEFTISIINKGRRLHINSVIPANQLVLYRLSSHWFSTEKPDNGRAFGDEQIQQCLICLSSPSEMVWMPCGHLSTCRTCCEYLIKQRKNDCILCKATGSYCLKIKAHEGTQTNEYQIEDRIYIGLY